MTKEEKLKASLDLARQLILLTLVQQQLAAAVEQVESKAVEGSRGDG